MSLSHKDNEPDQRIAPPEDHFKEIYRSRASEYHRMVSAEDVDGQILPALQSITPFERKRILDVGSGTGRIPLLLGEMPALVVAVDISLEMLAESRRQREAAGGRWELVQADIGGLPVRSGIFDVVVAGWAIGHQTFWNRNVWMAKVAAILREMERAVRNQGSIIILETLGTGAVSPAPPAPELEGYYRWLEDEKGFHRDEISTDYLFSSLDDAVTRTNFFFGEGLSEKIRENQWQRLPEWTGVWSKIVHSN